VDTIILHTRWGTLAIFNELLLWLLSYTFCYEFSRPIIDSHLDHQLLPSTGFKNRFIIIIIIFVYWQKWQNASTF